MSPRPVAWLRPKYLLFAAIGAMMAYVAQHNERFVIETLAAPEPFLMFAFT